MFDIEANINDDDSRAGLDERGTQEVLEIMRRERVKYVCRRAACITYSCDRRLLALTRQG